MNRRSLWSRPFPVLALLLCAAPALGTAILGPSSALANERQSAAPRLTVEGALNPELPAECAAYFSDHFFLRRELITLRNGLNARLGGTGDGEVLPGKHGWLYYRPTVSDYAGTARLSDAALTDLARNLALMQEYAAEQGAGFVFLIAPNKNSLYPDNMPDLGVRTEPGGPEGCVLLRGTIPDSQGCAVYLRCGDAVYEAFSLADGGFAAYLPEGAAADLAALFRNDQWELYPIA